MGGECSTHRITNKCMHVFAGYYDRKTDIGCEDIDWIYLAQDIDQCWVLLNQVLNYGFYKRKGFTGWMNYYQLRNLNFAP
jgi:hypothetical protein